MEHLEGRIIAGFQVRSRRPKSRWDVVCLTCGVSKEVRTPQLQNPEKYGLRCLECSNRRDPDSELVGRKFGSLRVLRYEPKHKQVKNAKGYLVWNGAWVCRCDCGIELKVISNRLIHGKTTSCGCQAQNKSPELEGQRFGKLLVTGVDLDSEGRKSWLCTCDCGEKRSISTDKLVSGRQVSCGCSKLTFKPSELRLHNQLEHFKKLRTRTYLQIAAYCADNKLTLETTVKEFQAFQSAHRDHLKFRCDKNHTFEIAWFNLKTVPYCRKCFQWKSAPEQEMKEFLFAMVGQEKVYPNAKNIVPGVNEVDMYLPEYKLAVEHNGLFYHQLQALEKKDRHFKKRELLEAAGIQCIQINGDEWATKRPIVESMLRARLGFTERKIHARDLEVYEPTPDEANTFVAENHLMGPFRAARPLGLRTKEGELVCLITYRREGDGLEIARMCSKLNCHVVGGVSRLLAHLPLEGVKSLVSFVDLRYATGHSLTRLGFKRASVTLGWRWTDLKSTYNRRACRANMDERGLSEADHAAELKLTRIYDAGQARFVKVLDQNA